MTNGRRRTRRKGKKKKKTTTKKKRKKETKRKRGRRVTKVGEKTNAPARVRTRSWTMDLYGERRIK